AIRVCTCELSEIEQGKFYLGETTGENIRSGFSPSVKSENK
ncbi:hypothetical protein PRABACTJOHN_04475, partial [Parabacteroides johnsonii DSM 18315]